MELTRKLQQLREKGEGAHMPHVYYGDPSEEFSMRLISTLSENGADILEFGIPFSDPTADGPTFIAACERALKKDVTPTKCIDAIRELKSGGLELPIVVTSYYNILYVAGEEHFLRSLKEAGADAIIIPNLPIEETGTLLSKARRTGIHIILQVTQTTTGERLKKICELSSGFIYVINVQGVTGSRDQLSQSTIKLIERVRSHTDTPILAGFGISKPAHARSIIKAGADGAIAGSVYTKIYEKYINEPDLALPEISRLANQMKKACSEGTLKRD
ncbi:tryptophan synthase subunit alpha [Candidatus Bathyarchaeota archaeon]|nr:tryptophan synthase subunit alpha [Candidatus Bathyarchaeota archaeon]